MKQKLLLKTMLLLFALIAGSSSAWAGDPETIWSENFNGLAANATPYDYHRHKSTDYYQKECFSNQRYLQSAIEMYNMDNTDLLDTAFPGQEFEKYHKLLVEKKYLKNYLTSKGNICSYGFVDMTSSGGVFCKTHGTTASNINEDPIYPKVDSLSEKPYFEKYINLQNAMREESKILKNKSTNHFDIFQLLFDDPKIPGFLLVITIAYACISSIISKTKNNNQQKN